MTAGLLVQIEGAGDYLLATELNRPEYADNLGPLTHALATFYGRPDPGRGILDQSRFLQRLCRDRFHRSCDSWRQSADRLHQILFSDAAQLCPPVMERVPIGAEIPKDICSRLSRVALQVKKAVAVMGRRWPEGSLYSVRRCDYQAVSAVVVELAPDRLWINGLDVVPLTEGHLPMDPDLPAALQSMLAAGAAVIQARTLLNDDRQAHARGSKAGTETGAEPSSATAAGRVLLRVRRGVSWSTVSWVLRLAASVNLSLVSFRLVDGSGRPCHVSVRLWNLPLPPAGVKILVGRPGSRVGFCQAGRCLSVAVSELASRLGCRKGRCRRAWFLSVEGDDFSPLAAVLAQMPSSGGPPVLWTPGGLSLAGARRPCRPGAPCPREPGSHRSVRPGLRRGLLPRQ